MKGLLSHDSFMRVIWRVYTFLFHMYTYGRSHVTRIDIGRDTHTWHDVICDMTWVIYRMNESCYTYERSHVTRIDIGRDRHTWHDVIRDMTLGCIHMCEICPLQYVCGSYHIFGKKMGRNIHKGGHRLSQVCHVGYISSNGVYIFHRYDTMNHSFIRGICFS